MEKFSDKFYVESNSDNICFFCFLFFFSLLLIGVSGFVEGIPLVKIQHDWGSVWFKCGFLFCLHLRIALAQICLLPFLMSSSFSLKTMYFLF